MKRIIIDREKCDGCLNCNIACISAHQEGSDFYTVDLQSPDSETRNFIKFDPETGYTPIFCRHCAEPECVLSCMSGALEKNKDTGFVQYDKNKCAACFMCVMNCPYGVLKPDRKTKTKVIKCDFCQEKTDGPSCVKACPKKAIVVQEVER
ncbi:MAG: 4Fe-4S dicluster domain-containing protein [Eubacteriaceae bacterium]